MENGKTYSGFTVREIRPLPELEARLYRMDHEKSGARLVWLDRKDENKTFGIAFRTLPSDDTGVFHILEHSVLCGSNKYRVKEPFVELMKSSMNTFLNAMTFPDKTFYPISSRNPKDFLNLMRVYMDAVLHPLIYTKPEIFRQEGWHYEMPKDGGEVSYKGVVFNEMKGAYASADTLLGRSVLRQLFPDTCYGCDSGGDPVHIPELTYEQFLASHRKFYHPSNSYIFLDGQMDVQEVLSILDGEFLCAYDRQDGQPEFSLQAPVKSPLLRASYEISPNESAASRARLAWGYVLGDYTCREEVTAMHAIADALCGGNQSPLKERILSAGLGQDVSIQVEDGILQPVVVLEVRNMDDSRAGEVESAVRSELERLVREGMDHERRAAPLANMEFQMRERDYGRMPQGLGLGMGVLGSWLYGGDPAANLEVGELFASLNRKLEEGYFEALLERTLLRSEHSCQVLLVPSATLGEENRAAEAARLRSAGGSWTPAERAALEEQQAALDAWQASVDTPEALASIPALRLEDIPTEPEDVPLEVGELCGVPLLRHHIPTGGVGYVSLYFDISDLTAEQLPCAALLCALLGELDTASHDSLTLQKLQRLLLGAIHFSIEPYGRVNEPDSCRTYLCVSFSALEAKLEKAAALILEIAASTRFDDTRQLRNLVRQYSAQMEQSAAANGHSFAVTRVSAGFSAEGAVREHIGGLSYCQWLKELERNFDGRAAALTEQLQGLCARIFTAGRLTIGVTGVEDACAAALERTVLAQLPAGTREDLPCAVGPWGVRKEGIVLPVDVSFAALGGSLLRYGIPYSGALRVASRAVTLAYLWNVIRVQGGAYGTGMGVSDSGNVSFYSYRDPGAARSLACYRQTADFLTQFCGGAPDLTGLIIGAVAESDPLMLPSRKGRNSDGLYLKGVTYADRRRRRAEMLSAKPEELAAMAEALRKLGETGGVCVVGSKEQIAACGQELDQVFTL